MTARTSISPEQRRAEVEGAWSGFHIAVGYLRSAVEHGNMVDPARLLALMTSEAERTAAIWLTPPAHEHQLPETAPASVPLVGELMDVHGDRCARCDRRLAFRNVRSADAPVVHHVRGSEFRLWCLRCDRSAGVGDVVGVGAVGVDDCDVQAAVHLKAQDAAGGEAEADEGSAVVPDRSRELATDALGLGLLHPQDVADDRLDVGAGVIIGERPTAACVEDRDGHESSPRSVGVEAPSVGGPDPVGAAAPGSDGAAGGNLLSGGHPLPPVLVTCARCWFVGDVRDVHRCAEVPVSVSANSWGIGGFL